MEHTIEQVFATTAERLWDAYFFDDAFVEGLYERLGLHIDDMQVQHEGAGPTLVAHRRLRLTARRGLSRLPQALQGLVHGRTAVVETGEFSAQRRRYSVQLDLPGVLRIVDCGGDWTWEDLPEGLVRRRWHGRCVSRLPALGGRLARYLLGEIEAGLTESYVFTSRWLREHPAALAAS
jgi:hypothetical protein